jgi:hypothetical protein
MWTRISHKHSLELLSQINLIAASWLMMAKQSQVTHSGGYRAVRRCRTMTVCDETSAPGRHTGRPQAQVSVNQKRHGEHDSVTVTIAEGFRSASYDLSIFVRNDVRHS